MGDDLRQQPSMTATFAQPGAKPGDAIGVAKARHATDERQAVRRVGDGAVDDRMDAGRLQRRNERHRPFHHVRHAVEIVGAQGVHEVRIDAAKPPGAAILLVEADQQAVLLLALVEVVLGAADERHAEVERLDLGKRLGEHVLMLHRGDGMLHAHHRTDLVAAVAAGIDDLVRADVALRRVHDPAVVRLLREARHGRMAMHLGAGLAGTAGERLAQLCGVDVAVERIPQRTQHLVGVQQRVAPPAFGGIEQLELHAHAARQAQEVRVAIEMILGMRQPEAAGSVMVVDRVVRIVGQLLVERDRVRLQAEHALVGAEIRDLRGRVPGGARGQLVALQEHAVRDALLRQVVERGAAADAASDHDDLGLRLHDPSCTRLPGTVAFAALASSTALRHPTVEGSAP